MHRFKKVGLVFDLDADNRFVLQHAEELIETNQATIHIICVLPNLIDDVATARLKSAIAEHINFDYKLAILFGQPTIQITRYSQRNDLDLLMLEPESESVFRTFFRGSLTLSLIRKAPCPVWVTKAAISKSYERILVAIDTDETNTDPKLNDKLIEIGTSYAQRQSAECTLATAWRLEGESILTGPFIATPDEEIEVMKNEQKIRAARDFEAIQQRHSERLKGVETRMLYGDPEVAIPRYIKDEKIDLVIMGSLGRSGVTGFIIGNTAETIINLIDCSIMAIKPDGFESPILA